MSHYLRTGFHLICLSNDCNLATNQQQRVHTVQRARQDKQQVLDLYYKLLFVLKQETTTPGPSDDSPNAEQESGDTGQNVTSFW